jgi:carnitine O-acetyltransferase
LIIINSCAASKHLQTKRYLDTLRGYLLDIQRILIQLHRDANERPEPFVDHAGVLRDSKTGRAINGDVDHDAEEESITIGEFLDYHISIDNGINLVPGSGGYSFFDSGDVELVPHMRKSPYHHVGEWSFRTRRLSDH